MRDLWPDLRHAARALRRSAGFTATVVLTLALGIGANAAIFSVVDAVLLRALPVREPSRLVLFSDGSGAGRWGWDELTFTSPGLDLYSSALYRRLRESTPLFDGLAALDSTSATALVKSHAQDASADHGSGRSVSAGYFSVLGVPASLGRTFLPDEEGAAPGANPIVVLSHAYWQRRFGGAADVVGSRLTINGRSYTVVGVTPAGFTGSEVGAATDFWVPLCMQAELGRERELSSLPSARWLFVIGRLKPGVAMAAAEAQVNLVLRRFLTETPSLVSDRATREGLRIVLDRGATGISAGPRQRYREPLLVLMAGVTLLLLIVCLNVSHLLLARGLSRQREMSIRTTLGATRARLARQLLVEGLLLSAMGAAGGTLASRWLAAGLLSLAAGGGSPLAFDLRADGRVLSFCTLLALGMALLLGLVPAWQASRTDLQQSLRGTSHTVTSSRRRLASRLLLISQVGVSLVLLVGAGLMSSSLGRLREVDKGFDQEHVLLITLSPGDTGLGPAAARPLYDDLLRRVTALPDVRTASLSHLSWPLLGGREVSTIVEPVTGLRGRAMIGAVTPDHLQVVGIGLARGRAFTAADRQGSPRVAVVNEALTRLMFPGQDALGRRFRFGADPDDVTVVGIVRDARMNGLRREPRAMAYLPAAQTDRVLGDLEVRTGGDPALAVDQVRQAVRQTHPDLMVLSARTMRSHVERSMVTERLMATVSTAFGLAALFLVCIGLYGVIAQWTAQRTREIGVRVALGATTGRVRWMVLRQAFTFVLAGLGLGLPAVLAASGLLRGLLFGVQPLEPRILAGAALVLFAVATLAAYLPARRASRVDPALAMRSE